jgi:hypothetical protein
MAILDGFDHPPNDEELRYLLDNPNLENERRFIESLWERYEPYADRQFRTEIKFNFHRRYWEMYLACSLMECELELMPRDKEKGPDLCLQLNKSRVWIEAVAPSGGQGPDAITERALNPNEVDCFSVPEKQIILRYLSSIKEKQERYTAYLEDGTISPSEPYIIAINGRRVPYSYSDSDDEIPIIVKAVLPFGQYVVKVDFDKNEIVDQRYTYRAHVEKANKAKVATRFFLDRESSGISGILFSNSDLLNRPQQLGADFIYIHNPLASNHLPRGWCPTGQEYRLENNILCVHMWSR